VSELQHAAFATFGLFTLSQELAGRAREVIPEGDPEILAEEGLCLAAAVTARTVEAVLGTDAELARALLAAPFLYRDYLVGSAMLASGDQTIRSVGADIGQRLERKMAFYASHLEPGVLPSGSKLKEKALLWMGRISPPKMTTGPEQRLADSGVVPRLETHVRLVAAHVRNQSG